MGLSCHARYHVGIGIDLDALQREIGTWVVCRAMLLDTTSALESRVVCRAMLLDTTSALESRVVCRAMLLDTTSALESRVVCRAMLLDTTSALESTWMPCNVKLARGTNEVFFGIEMLAQN